MGLRGMDVLVCLLGRVAFALPTVSLPGMLPTFLTCDVPNYVQIAGYGSDRTPFDFLAPSRMSPVGPREPNELWAVECIPSPSYCGNA